MSRYSLLLVLLLCACTTDPSSKAEELVRALGKHLGDVIAFKKLDGEKTVVNGQDRYRLEYRMVVKMSNEFHHYDN